MAFSSVTVFGYQGNIAYHMSDEPHAIVEQLEFESNSFDGLSDAERGMERVSGLTLHMSGGGSSLSYEQLELIGQSEFAQIVSTYHIEQVQLTRSGEATSELVNVSRDEYFANLTAFDQYSQYSQYAPVVIVDSNDAVTIDSNDFEAMGASPLSDFGNFNIGGGRMRMQVVVFFTDLSVTNFRYVVLGEFIWDAMPSQRLTDVFGVSRGYNTVEFGDFNASTYVYRQRFQGFARFGQPIPFGGSTWLGTYNIRNDSNNNNHFAIRMSVPRDTPTPHVLEGTWVTIDRFHALQGSVSFTGGLNSISVIPGGLNVINFNHWGTYAHQRRGTALNMSAGFGVSFPTGFTAGFSVNPNLVSDFTTERVTNISTIQVRG